MTVIEELPLRARLLPCVRCGRTLAGHAGEPPDCQAFVRPDLPVGYAYVDELHDRDAFRFRSLNQRAAVRVATRAPSDLDGTPGLVLVRSRSGDAPEDGHLVEPNTVVVRWPLSA